MPDPVPGDRPAISVIVIAHQRRKFLMDAVTSVQNQDLERDAYEVVVVKDFEDPQVDDYLERTSALRIDCATDLTAGAMFAEGVRRTKGDFLCFLDDDDRFLPSKLGYVRSVSGTHPGVGFVHNRQRIVDATGVPLQRQPAHHHPGHEKQLKLESARDYARAVVSCDMGFNNSSICIRREVLTPRLAEFARVRVNCDNFLALIAYLSGTGILCSDLALNDFRIHGAGSSGAFTGGTEKDFFAGRRSYFEKVLDDTNLFLEMADGTVAEPMIRFFQAYSNALYQMSDVLPHRHTVGRSLLGILSNPQQRVIYSGRLLDTLSLATVLLFYLALPETAKSTYYQAKTMSSIRSVKRAG